jgi:hypothetical protein
VLKAFVLAAAALPLRAFGRLGIAMEFALPAWFPATPSMIHTAIVMASEIARQLSPTPEEIRRVRAMDAMFARWKREEERAGHGDP